MTTAQSPVHITFHDIAPSPGVASREPGRNRAHEDVHVAIRDAFDAARHEPHDRVEWHHGR